MMLCIKVFEQHPSDTSGSKDSNFDVSDIFVDRQKLIWRTRKLISEAKKKAHNFKRSQLTFSLVLRVAEIIVCLFG